MSKQKIPSAREYTSRMVERIVPISEIEPHPDNPRQHPDSQIMQLKASHSSLGQFEPVILWQRPTGYIQVKGHGYIGGVKLTEDTATRAWILPEDTPDAVVKQIMLASNLHAMNSTDDGETLARLLQEQQDLGFDLEALGSDDEALRQMLESLGDSYLGSDEGKEGEYNEDEEEDLAAPDAIFSQEIIATEAFKHFRNTGFPYPKLPLYMCMQELNKLASLDDDRLLHSTLGYHIADTYHPHRFHASAERMKSPLESFHNDDQLIQALHLYQEHSEAIPLNILSLLSLVRGTQACSNFRPGFAMYLYRKYCKADATVLDTSTGYGGRLVGFMASGLAGKYIGIDPNTETHQANLRMAHDLYFSGKVELYNLPAEDVPHEKVVGRCDFAFTSPPYFAKEHYSDDDTQSWKRYQTGDARRHQFLQKMLSLQFVALKSGSYAIVNIADVNLRGKSYPLAQWTIEDGKAVGFEYLETQEFPLNHRFGANHSDEPATEPVIVFRKPNC